MIPFKGRTGLLIYMPTKPTKRGLKAWGLADAKTGYMYNWQLYLGRENVQTPRAVGVAYQVVTSLTEPLYNKGHVVYMDNFFASPALFEDLAQHQTGACGTLHVNRQGVPDRIKTARPHVGQPPITHTVVHIRYISWYDKRPVNLITNVHSAQTYRKEVRSKRHQGHTRVVDKPCAVQSYSQHMGGIDRADKAMTYCMVLHRSTKWWKKVFFYLFEVCFCNALVIWKALCVRCVNAEKFRLRIVHYLFDGYQPGISHRKGRRTEDPQTAWY